jgi:hypothetical protein
VVDIVSLDGTGVLLLPFARGGSLVKRGEAEREKAENSTVHDALGWKEVGSKR